MCSVVGALLFDMHVAERRVYASDLLAQVYAASFARGRDGRGFVTIADSRVTPHTWKETDRKEGVELGDPLPTLFHTRNARACALIGNFRAEPTTEYVAHKREDDQQPYTAGSWSIVHNGTIANDKELRTGVVNTTIDSAAIVERLALPRAIQGTSGGVRPSLFHFRKTIQELKGSYAILAINHSEPDHMLVACNYRPVWYAVTEVGIYFASARDYLPAGYPRAMVQPYTVSSFILRPDGRLQCDTLPLLEQPEPRRALVVCSGGMDSVVAATYAQKTLGYDVTLLHFQYGSRAEGPELKAMYKIAEALGCELRVKSIPAWDEGDSPLLQQDSTIAGGEAGAEFAHEWVPARNLVMLSIATAYAEAKGFDTLILGNNLEEAGAYPDNEPEFIAKFNDLLPFAVGDGKQVHIEMPVGNLMKHEIVALGHQLGAPLALTWSCYRSGDKHCGTCGPCYMRRTAFKINGLEEVIDYVAG